MNQKEAILTNLENEYQRWNNYWLSLDDRGKVSILYGNRTNKDELAHLWEWQRMAEARLEAALQNSEPDYSYWPDWIDPLTESEGHIDQINDWVYKKNKSKSWDDLYLLWNKTFQSVIKLSRKIPEDQLLASRIFSWLGSYTLLDVLVGSYQHYHSDHWPNIERWVSSKR